MKPGSGRIIRLSVVTFGFTSIFTQVYLVREFLSVFYGNELVLAIVIANWMLLTGFGAYLGRSFTRFRGQLTFVLFLQVLFCILPLFTLVKLDLWKSLVFPYGSMPGPVDVLYSSFIIQVPFCLINGYLFTAYSELMKISGCLDPGGRTYMLESAGSVAAGLAVNFLLIWQFGPFTSLKLLLALNLVVLVAFSTTLPSRVFRWIIPLLAVPVLFIFFRYDLEGYSEKLLFPGQKVIYDHTTPYGTVVITENPGQLNFYENGLPLFSSHNEIFNEETVHFPMLQSGHPGSVLLVSGGISGTMKEILKYRPQRIDYVEVDPVLAAIGKKYSVTLDDPCIHVYPEDARMFIRRTGHTYDVAIINLPEPSTILLNRYYSEEFFRELKSRVNAGGIVSTSLASTADYVSRSAGALNSSLLHTLSVVFRNVLILPGQKNYFLASDGPLDAGIAALTGRRGIGNLYVNAWYLDDEQLKTRSGFITGHLDASAPVNRDFRPVAFYRQVQHWTSHFSSGYIFISLVFLVILALVVLSLNRVTAGLFTGGFTASSLELMILVSFQVIYGYVFMMTGIIIMIFMAGLAAGAYLRPRLFPDFSIRRFTWVQLGMALLSLGFPFIILFLAGVQLPVIVVHGVFYLLTLAVAMLTGLEFSMASSSLKTRVSFNAGKSYSADLFGSAFGALITGILLYPLFGITISCLFLVILNAFSAFILFSGRKKIVTL
jgi:spermidine synthase